MIDFERLFSDPSHVGSFHDTVCEAWGCHGEEFETSYLVCLSTLLTVETLNKAVLWSLSDTEFREMAREELKTLRITLDTASEEDYNAWESQQKLCIQTDYYADTRTK